MPKTLKQILEDFDKQFKEVDKATELRGNLGLSPTGNIKGFFSQNIRELLESVRREDKVLPETDEWDDSWDRPLLEGFNQRNQEINTYLDYLLGGGEKKV